MVHSQREPTFYSQVFFTGLGLSSSDPSLSCGRMAGPTIMDQSIICMADKSAVLVKIALPYAIY